MLETVIYQQDLTDQERIEFPIEFSAVRKNPTTGVLLALFLGGFGAYHFYLGRPRLGACRLR